MTAFAEMVDQLVAMNFPRDVAEKQVRLKFPNLAPPPADVEKDASVLEKKEQHEIVKLFRAYGCAVYSLSQARASKQSPGLPDLWVVHTGIRLAFWFETKRQVGGKLSTVQKQFRDECSLTGVRFYWGDRRSAAAVLLDHGVARAGDGPCGVVPFHEPRSTAATK